MTVIGFVSVRKNVEPYAPKRPRLLTRTACSEALDSRILRPRQHKKPPPIRRNQACWLTRKFEIKVRPKPAIDPYIPSAVTAPRPVTRPETRPSANVRRMHRTPIGPTGAAIERPMAMPLNKKATPIHSLMATVMIYERTMRVCKSEYALCNIQRWREGIEYSRVSVDAQSCARGNGWRHDGRVGRWEGAYVRLLEARRHDGRMVEKQKA